MLLDKSRPRQLVLASSSPYRQALLQRLHLPFSVQAPAIDETPRPDESPSALAQRLAAEKAWHVARQHPGHLVIGSDQVADFQGQPTGKPGSLDAAREQLQRFRGQAVRFHTALCVTDGQRDECATVPTDCRFLDLSDDQIDVYLRTEPALDTTGSAKIEGLGIALMQSVRSDDPTALIGLPLIALCRLLRRFEQDPLRATPKADAV